MSGKTNDDDEPVEGDGEGWKEGAADPELPAGASGAAVQDDQAAKAPIDRDGRYIRGFSIKLGQLLTAGRRAEFEIGGFIDEACRGRYWERWPVVDKKSPSFAIFCDKVLGYKKRKAEYLRNNWLKLKAINPPEDVLSRCLRLGWTKLAVILRSARTTDSLIVWMDRVEQFNLTEEELSAEVKAAVASLGPDGDESDGKPDPQKVPPERRPKDIITFSDPDALRLWTRVRAIMKERMGIEGKDKALAALCTAYLAMLPRPDEGGMETELDILAQHISRHYGKRVVLLDPDSTSTANPERVRRAQAMPPPVPTATAAAKPVPPPQGMTSRSGAADV
jgi:hypothetical protein